MISYICDEQHGFRHKRSCETQLILTIHDLAKSLDSGLQSDVIFLDFSKAFDKVDHRLLLHKLDHYGIWGGLLSWLRDFLTNRKQQVVIAGNQSLSADVTYIGCTSGFDTGTTPIFVLHKRFTRSNQMQSEAIC